MGVIVALIAIPVVLKLSRDDTHKAVDLERVATARADSDRARVGFVDL